MFDKIKQTVKEWLVKWDSFAWSNQDYYIFIVVIIVFVLTFIVMFFLDLIGVLDKFK